MDDSQHARTLFLIFAVMLVIYGAILVKTGDKNLLPYRAMHSVRNSEDVRRVGLITARIGMVIGIIMLVFSFIGGGLLD